jgi:hypothetical protein
VVPLCDVVEALCEAADGDLEALRELWESAVAVRREARWAEAPQSMTVQVAVPVTSAERHDAVVPGTQPW